VQSIFGHLAVYFLAGGCSDAAARSRCCPAAHQMQQRAVLLQKRLALATTAAATAWFASRELERQRRPLSGRSAPTVLEALPNLRASGVCVVDGVVDRGLVSAIKGTALFENMPMSSRPQRSTSRQERFESRRNGVEAAEWRVSSAGRYHRREDTWSADDLEVIERVERLLWPMVEAFFDDDDDEHRAQGIYRSELQMLNAVPGSQSQTWHSDNRSRGLTIIVPLVDFTADNGPTQVLVGSYDQSWTMVAQEGARVMTTPVGGIAAFDSRTYHRGLGNQTDEPRPALIFCYDRPDSPPPGVSSLGSLAHATLAAGLNLASACWLLCTSR